jgi:hypothetical protein
VAAALTAEIVAVFGVGNTVGALYSPLLEMVPVAAEPPPTPFTCHTTAWFAVPLTAAVNCVVSPSLTCDEPVTLTVTAGGVGAGGVTELPKVPEHPAKNNTAGAKTTAVVAFRGKLRRWQFRVCKTRVSQRSGTPENSGEHLRERRGREEVARARQPYMRIQPKVTEALLCSGTPMGRAG